MKMAILQFWVAKLASLEHNISRVLSISTTVNELLEPRDSSECVRILNGLEELTRRTTHTVLRMGTSGYILDALLEELVDEEVITRTILLVRSRRCSPIRS